MSLIGCGYIEIASEPCENVDGGYNVEFGREYTLVPVLLTKQLMEAEKISKDHFTDNAKLHIRTQNSGAITDEDDATYILAMRDNEGIHHWIFSIKDYSDQDLLNYSNDIRPLVIKDQSIFNFRRDVEGNERIKFGSHPVKELKMSLRHHLRKGDSNCRNLSDAKEKMRAAYQGKEQVMLDNNQLKNVRDTAKDIKDNKIDGPDIAKNGAVPGHRPLYVFAKSVMGDDDSISIKKRFPECKALFEKGPKEGYCQTWTKNEPKVFGQNRYNTQGLSQATIKLLDHWALVSINLNSTLRNEDKGIVFHITTQDGAILPYQDSPNGQFPSTSCC